jgi:hypothetical protein
VGHHVDDELVLVEAGREAPCETRPRAAGFWSSADLSKLGVSVRVRPQDRRRRSCDARRGSRGLPAQPSRHGFPAPSEPLLVRNATAARPLLRNHALLRIASRSSKRRPRTRTPFAVSSSPRAHSRVGGLRALGWNLSAGPVQDILPR